MPSCLTASRPVAPTTPAIAPKAPIGASHRIITRMRNTSFWIRPTALMIGSPDLPIACSAKPTSSATNRVCSTLPSVSADSSEVGMMCAMKSMVPPAACAFSASPAPAPASADRFMPLPGLQQIADHQADGQRDRGHADEVDQREAADLADARGAPHRADPEHDRAEDDRRDHHLDQADEQRAEHGEILADLGEKPPDETPATTAMMTEM